MTASENLTRAEAKERSTLIAVESYDVTIDVTTLEPTFPSVSTVAFTCRQPGSSTWIDLIAHSVESVVLNGTALDVAAAVDGPRITLPELQASNVVTVTAQCTYMNTGEGLHRFVDPVDKETYLYTQFESADARRMYACFEQPDLKAGWRLTVTTPGHWKVVSNSPSPTPDPAV
ncbi:MAG: gluzincin family metallopeptidase, partial [Candidatus Nanopelagicales bacterium]